MSKMKKYWFYIHPYVDVTIQKDKVLFYNTVNHEIFEYQDANISNILKSATNSDNLWVVELGELDIKERYNDFFSEIRSRFMGDYIDSFHSKEKPIQVYPRIKIKSDVDTYESVFEFSIGENILSYVSELTIYLTDAYLIPSQLSNAHLQFEFPVYCSDKPQELEFQILKETLSKLEHSGLRSINIIGGNPLLYSSYSQLINYFSELNYNFTFYFYYKDFAPNQEELETLIKLSPTIVLLVDNPVESDQFLKALSFLNGTNIETTINYIVEEESDVHFAKKLNGDYKVRLTPFFNQNNLDFFEKNIYITKSDIYSLKLSQNDIFTHTKINDVNFGKLTILSNGEVYSNLNQGSLGNISFSNFRQLIMMELKAGKSWRKTRMNVKPCSECVYMKLCPSISNYEYSIGSFNLCHI
jgi:pseudo-rSAM protein